MASAKAHAAVAILIPIVALGLPKMDALLSITRKVYRALPILTPKKEHIYDKGLFRKFLKHQSFIKGVISPRKLLGAERKNPEFVQSGHFYSPVPDLEEVKRHEKKIFRKFGKEIPGIDLHEDNQLCLLKQFRKYYKEIPFGPHKKDRLRYYFENSYYSYSDAIFL
ncbi:MAG: hypothetical protein ACFFCW_35690 [Candidatus Hodarchaeota archaeon]